MSNLTPNQFQIGDAVWNISEDDFGDLRAMSGGSEVLATMPANGSIPDQVAKLAEKLCAWAYAKGKSEGKEEVCASWEQFASREAAKAAEALAS
jgi:hypothetical protein